jgi:hypothetical protein
MRNLFFYLFATLFITAGLFNQWQQVECVAADTLQDDELMQDELLLDPYRKEGGGGKYGSGGGKYGSGGKYGKKW